MIALLNQIPSDAKIRKEFRKMLFGKNMFCPLCRSRRVIKSEERYWCRKCRKHFSLLSNTWLSNMKLSLRTFWALLWCWTQKIPILQTMKLCHVSEITARYWFRQFRLQLPEFMPILTGIVQMDEAYSKKLSLFMAKQINSKNLVWQCLSKKSVDKHDAMEFIFQNIQPNTKLHTDGSAIYSKVNNWWPVKHKKDIHRKYEFGLTSEIEGMFGNLRTFIRRMYHHATPEYWPEYVSEFCLRFSSPEMFISPNHYLMKTLKPVPTC